MNNTVLVKEDDILDASQDLSLIRMGSGILIPFYFSNNRYNPNGHIDLNIKNIVKKNIYDFLTIINDKRKLKNTNSLIEISEYDYKEQYPHIDFKNKKHPFSFLFKFNSKDYLSDFFSGFNLHVYHDEDHDNLNGGIELQINELNDCSFNKTLKRVYVSNFIEYFMENYFLPELTATFPEVIISKTSRALDSHIDTHKLLNTQAHILTRSETEWKKLVEEKFNESEYEFLNNKLFNSLISTLMLIINILNVVRLSIIFNNSKIFDNFEFNISSTYSANRFLYDYDLFYRFFKKYKNIDFQDNNSKNLTTKKFKNKANIFTQIKLSFAEIFYFHNMMFQDIVKEWITDGYSDNEVAESILNRIRFVINSTLNSQKFMLSIKSKNFIKLDEFIQIANNILRNENFIKENMHDVNDLRFYSNSHFSAYNNKNYLLLVSTENSITEQAWNALNYFYIIGVLYFGAHYIEYKELESYTSFVVSSGYGNKNLAYRRIIRELRVIFLDLNENYYGINSLRYIVNQLEKQYHLLTSVKTVIEKVRKEDEADKLTIERNAIATAFICALFVGIIWFVDQCFATLQSTASGVDSAGNHYPGYTDWTISMSIIYGFVGLAAFVIFIITIILIYQCTKIYITYKNTKNTGLRNIY